MAFFIFHNSPNSKAKQEKKQSWSIYRVNHHSNTISFSLCSGEIFNLGKIGCNLDVYEFVIIYGKEGAYLLGFKMGMICIFFDFNRFTRSDDLWLWLGIIVFNMCLSVYTKWKICSKPYTSLLIGKAPSYSKSVTSSIDHQSLML